jgi:NTP pyrophosphatase (non-canonical NTP hydrolase)
MTFDEYQKLASRTMKREKGEELPRDMNLAVMSLGLAGESGEVVDMVKKFVGHGHTIDIEKLTKELGDVMWYLAAICEAMGISFDAVAESNIEKLKRRYPEGFTYDSSRNRKE